MNVKAEGGNISGSFGGDGVIAGGVAETTVWTENGEFKVVLKEVPELVDGQPSTNLAILISPASRVASEEDTEGIRQILIKQV